MSENIFDKFDNAINVAELEKARENAQNNIEVPSGEYRACIENMEMGLTKSDKRPMFKVQMRLIKGIGADEGEFLSRFKKKKPCVFMNRVMFGTKNDANMIASVEGWINKIFPDEPVAFETYSQFADEVLDVAEATDGMEFRIQYDPDKFNSISILEVYD